MVFWKKTPGHGNEPGNGNAEKFCIFHRSHQGSALSRHLHGQSANLLHHILCVITWLCLTKPPQDSTSSALKPFPLPRSLLSTLLCPGLHQTLPAILKTPVACSIWANPKHMEAFQYVKFTGNISLSIFKLSVQRGFSVGLHQQ